jgi:hypothetical protein
VVTGTSVRFTGTAYHPEFDLPVSVKFALAPTAAGAPVPARIVTADAPLATVPPALAGLGPFHGIDTTFTGLTPGTYLGCGMMVLWGETNGPSLGCTTFTVV